MNSLGGILLNSPKMFTSDDYIIIIIIKYQKCLHLMTIVGICKTILAQ